MEADDAVAGSTVRLGLAPAGTLGIALVGSLGIAADAHEASKAADARPAKGHAPPGSVRPSRRHGTRVRTVVAMVAMSAADGAGFPRTRSLKPTNVVPRRR